MQNHLRRIAVFAFFLFAFWTSHAASIPSADEIPTNPFDDRFSTNWDAAVRAALPDKNTAQGNYDFKQATNDLCHASSKGNLAAQALWGFALIVSSGSPEALTNGLKVLRGSAEKGCVPAMVNLGYLFESGRYVRRNYNEAIQWFSKAAELGNADAQLQLGACYHYGLGTTPDFTQAAKYYRLSAEQTNFVAMKCLGFLLMNGYGVDKNEVVATYWLMRAANEGGNRRAMFNLGVLYGQQYPDTNAMIEAFKWIKKGAELGDALAANELSNFYLRGWGGTETNLASYHYWRFKAAYLGATDAQYFVGQAYRTGDGVPKDAEASLLWIGKAAAKNHPEAIYDLAVHFYEARTNPPSLQLANQLMIRAALMGHREAQFQCAMSAFRGDLTQNCEWGKEWLSRAAENGWPKAEFTLFQLFFNGLAPGKDCPAYPKDKIEGIKWLRRAAEHGNVQAQAILAVMLIRGVDLDQDKITAEKLLRDAAAHGYTSAQNDLGFAILHGDTAQHDLVETAMWCKLATAEQTDTNVAARAAYNLSYAMSKLSLDQQDEADRRARQFEPLPIPQMDPKVKDWEKNPDYQREDGRYGH
jgi:TPR repeat protein